MLGEGSARPARVDASAGLLALRSRAGIVSGGWMRSALLLQFVDVYDGGAGVGIGIFYIDDAGRLLFLLLYFFGYDITGEVSVSFVSVCFAKGR